jgi:hypothetical protein
MVTCWGLALAEDEAHGGGRWLDPAGRLLRLDWTEIPPARSRDRSAKIRYSRADWIGLELVYFGGVVD